MALTDNLISYWKLDESSGNASDAVGSNTLTNVGTCAYGTGKINNGVQTVKDTKYLESSTSSGLAVTGSFSLNFWVNWSSLSTTTWNGLVSKCDNTSRAYRLGALNVSGSTYQVLFGVGTGGGSDYTTSFNTTLNTSTWYMFTFVYDSSAHSNTIYVNASSLGTDTGAPASITAGTANFRIGWFNNPSSTDGSTGTFDECGFWSRALSSSESTSLYNAGAGLAYPFASAAASVSTSLMMGI